MNLLNFVEKTDDKHVVELFLTAFDVAGCQILYLEVHECRVVLGEQVAFVEVD